MKPGPQPRDADELHDALVTLGGITETEGMGNRWRDMLDSLITENRATVLDVDGCLRVWVAAERLQHWQMLHGTAVGSPVIAAVSARGFECVDRDQVVRELVRSRMEGVGPISSDTLCKRPGLRAKRCRPGLACPRDGRIRNARKFYR